MPVGVGTTRSCCCWRGWACVSVRSPGSRSTTSTGAPGSSWSEASARGPLVCRCRATSARRSPTTCGTSGRPARPHCLPALPAPIRPFVRGRRQRGRGARERTAGIGSVRAHRLRHTVATELLRRGAGLVEIRPSLASRERGRDGDVREGRPGGAVAAGLALGQEVLLMSRLSQPVEDYLTLRRSLGYKSTHTAACFRSSSSSSSRATRR